MTQIFLITLIVFFFIATVAAVTQDRRAYATLLYTDAYALSVRVLAASLRHANGEDRTPLYCLVTSHVSASTVRALAADGVIVHAVEHIDIDPTLAPARLRYVYTKLAAWTLDQLSIERVVFLDSDTLVRRSIAHLFNCGPRFCASLRQEDYFNAGVLVFTPSTRLYTSWMRLLVDEPQRHDQEQGFLNVLYARQLLEAPYFDEHVSNSTASPASGARAGVHADVARLAYTYNADPLLYTLARNRWKTTDAMVALRGPHILHFIGSHAKPWLWPSYLVFASCWEWHAVRMQLDDAAGARVRSFFTALLFLAILAAAAVHEHRFGLTHGVQAQRRDMPTLVYPAAVVVGALVASFFITGVGGSPFLSALVWAHVTAIVAVLVVLAASAPRAVWLRDATLYDATLYDVTLRDAALRDATLRDATLSSARLWRAAAVGALLWTLLFWALLALTEMSMFVKAALLATGVFITLARVSMGTIAVGR